MTIDVARLRLPDDGLNDAVGRSLGKRHREVLALAAQGHTNHQIAKELRLATATVKTHLENARQRLGARNTTHAVILALVTGQLSLGEASMPSARSVASTGGPVVSGPGETTYLDVSETRREADEIRRDRLRLRRRRLVAVSAAGSRRI